MTPLAVDEWKTLAEKYIGNPLYDVLQFKLQSMQSNPDGGWRIKASHSSGLGYQMTLLPFKNNPEKFQSLVSFDLTFDPKIPVPALKTVVVKPDLKKTSVLKNISSKKLPFTPEQPIEKLEGNYYLNDGYALHRFNRLDGKPGTSLDLTEAPTGNFVRSQKYGLIALQQSGAMSQTLVRLTPDLKVTSTASHQAPSLTGLLLSADGEHLLGHNNHRLFSTGYVFSAGTLELEKILIQTKPLDRVMWSAQGILSSMVDVHFPTPQNTERKLKDMLLNIDFKTGKVLFAQEHSGELELVPSLDSTLTAVVNKDSLDVLDTRSLSRISLPIKNVSTAAFSQDSRILAFANGSTGKIYFFDVKNRKLLPGAYPLQSKVYHLSWTPDGNLVVNGSLVEGKPNLLTQIYR
ncbi:WD40 repeat domain-containing protein [Deinococcus roseus]|uniref:WD40 repeat domain-containing protein n=1 Tax=Deinococcus roseus TaxID=392414 RepID=UPI00166360BA|nr:WD40 repeat domain-containing protein [Deinococcus roseus]